MSKVLKKKKLRAFRLLKAQQEAVLTEVEVQVSVEKDKKQKEVKQEIESAAKSLEETLDKQQDSVEVEAVVLNASTTEVVKKQGRPKKVVSDTTTVEETVSQPVVTDEKT